MMPTEELEIVLKYHAQLYPEMEPTDAVKLIYQNEFGGGHLIKDEPSCLEALRREYATVEKDRLSMRSVEIGNGFVRIHLPALTERELEDLGRRFIECGRVQQGSIQQFVKKLDVLRSLTREGLFSFDEQILESYLTAYLQSGCPMVSHSQRYREHYHPAYRVVRK